MKPVISDVCIACGTCEAICPEVFKVTDVGGKMIATVLDVDYATLEAKIDEAVGACPVQAISKE
jgi:ferredoxin